MYEPIYYEECMVKYGFKCKKDLRLEDWQDKYILEGLAFMQNVEARTYPTCHKNFHITIKPHWAGYRCWYDDYYVDKDLEIFEVESRFVISVKMFNFPILILDQFANLIYQWLLGYLCHSTCQNIFRHLLLMIIKCKQLGYDYESLYDVNNHRIKGATLGRLFRTVCEPNDLQLLQNTDHINGFWPVAPDEKYLKRIIGPEFPKLYSHTSATGNYHDYLRKKKAKGKPAYISTYYVIHNKPMSDKDKNFYYPVIPAEFYIRDESFSVKEWSLLL